MNPLNATAPYDLSIIVPIDLSRRTKDIYRRAIRLAQALDGRGIQLILGCSAQPQRWVQKLTKVLSTYPHVRIALAEHSQCHLATIRNTALAQVTTRYVLFMDVDLYPDLAQIDQAYQDVQASQEQLCMYPCLYLTAAGSKKLGRVPTAEFKQYYYQFKREWILHLAFPSSIIICDIASVREIQGFDEAYVGHGYEDFDFMIRLFLHKGLMHYGPALHIDEAYKAPMMATGFRAILAQAQLAQLLQGNYFVHDYHGKDKQEDYYQQRRQNQIYFKQKITALEPDHPCVDKPNPLQLLNHFYALLQAENIMPSEYAALWAEIPGHMFRGKWGYI